MPATGRQLMGGSLKNLFQEQMKKLFGQPEDTGKTADINLDIDEGDTLLGGRFKNHPVEVKDIGLDDNNQHTVNGRPLLSYRIAKQMPPKKEKEAEYVPVQNVLPENGVELPVLENAQIPSYPAEIPLADAGSGYLAIDVGTGQVVFSEKKGKKRRKVVAPDFGTFMEGMQDNGFSMPNASDVLENMAQNTAVEVIERGRKPRLKNILKAVDAAI